VLGGESFEFLFVAADVEVDVVDLTAFHRLIQLLALDVESGDLVIGVIDETLGEVCADESTCA
jgi:hypothetical protein